MHQLFHYTGPLTIQFINETCKDIEKDFGTNTLTGKKLYSIFVELAQNIFYYSNETCNIGNEVHGVGEIGLYEASNLYELSASNIVDAKKLGFLEEKCRQINSLDRSALRKMKFEQRSSNDSSPDSKGAGVGLIQIALTADEKLRVDFEPMEQRKAYFKIAIAIKKI